MGKQISMLVKADILAQCGAMTELGHDGEADNHVSGLMATVGVYTLVAEALRSCDLWLSGI